MVYKDSHLHIGSYQNTKMILENTIYLNKYKAYSSINPLTIKNQDIYLNTIDDFFAIPIIFKEINIEKENNYTKSFCKKIKKGVPVTLINNNEFFNENIDYSIMKEHFILHDANNYNSRSLYYDYLNEHEGFLILHCKDKIRINYIESLRKNFPMMNIIVAHLGRNTIENHNDIINLLNHFKNDDNIYFDISTVNNIDTILAAIKIAGSDKILYGSDFPYEFNLDKEISKRKLIENSLINDYSTLTKISGDNFDKIKCRIYKK